MTGCGPGMQSVYEGNVRFEHCYRLDLDPNVAPTHRKACWEQWVTTYSYGQTRDKLEYAKRRIRYLNAGQTAAEPLDLRDPQIRAATDPDTPVNIHAPPPSVEGTSAPQPATTAALAPTTEPPRVPGRACTDACTTALTRCLAPCTNTPTAPTCATCPQDYGVCVRRCYE